MKDKLMLVIVMGLLMISCESREKQQLRATIDSLQLEIQEREAAQQMLREMGTLLDSIDDSRSLIKANMVKPEGGDNYIVRLRNINRYVKEMEGKMNQIEQSRQRARIRSSVDHPGRFILKSEDVAQRAELHRMTGKDNI